MLLLWLVCRWEGPGVPRRRAQGGAGFVRRRRRRGGTKINTNHQVAGVLQTHTVHAFHASSDGERVGEKPLAKERTVTLLALAHNPDPTRKTREQSLTLLLSSYTSIAAHTVSQQPPHPPPLPITNQTTTQRSPPDCSRTTSTPPPSNPNPPLSSTTPQSRPGYLINTTQCPHTTSLPLPLLHRSRPAPRTRTP